MRPACRAHGIRLRCKNAAIVNRLAFVSGAASLVALRPLPESLAAIEARHGGSLGVFGLDTSSGARIVRRANERFAMCSTFKVPLVAAVLARVDRGAEHLARRIHYARRDLLAYAPVTSAHVDRGFMTVEMLAQAAIERSDNTAANLLLASIGGPPALTAFARAIGDRITRFDRFEPALNTAIPGDIRDTTTPAAMVAALRTLTLGPALSIASRSRLVRWMNQCTTGDHAIRAGLPVRWRAGDKTGSGAHATSNDIALLFPPGRPPIVVAAYFTDSRASREQQRETLADVGRVVVAAFSA